MNIPMRVHRVSTHPVEVEVVFNGQKAMATLPELEVELTCDDNHGSQVLHFRAAAEIEEARSLFKQGDMVMLSFAMVGPSQIKTEADSAEAPAA